MSHMLSLLNRLKAEANRDMLTSSQLDAFREIEKLWRFPEHVNLWGSRGCGKTFLGWTLARAFQATIFPSPFAIQMHAPDKEECVVVDNIPDSQISLRRVLADLQLRSSPRAVLITAQPCPLGFPHVGISTPTAQDIDIVYRNLSLLEHYALMPLRSGELWEVVYSVL